MYAIRKITLVLVAIFAFANKASCIPPILGLSIVAAITSIIGDGNNCIAPNPAQQHYDVLNIEANNQWVNTNIQIRAQTTWHISWRTSLTGLQEYKLQDSGAFLAATADLEPGSTIFIVMKSHRSNSPIENMTLENKVYNNKRVVPYNSLNGSNFLTKYTEGQKYSYYWHHTFTQQEFGKLKIISDKIQDESNILEQFLYVYHPRKYNIEYSISDPKVVGGGARIKAHGVLSAGAYNIYSPYSGNLYIRAVSNSDGGKIFERITGAVVTDKEELFDSKRNIGGAIDSIVNFIVGSFRDVSKNLFNKVISSKPLRHYVKVFMIIYVMFYGLYFLLGAVQFTTEDFIKRVLKIVFISYMFFGDGSYTFFNEYLYELFVSASKSIVQHTLNSTSTSVLIQNNFDVIWQGWFWKIILVYLIQFHNGLFFIGLIALKSLITQLKVHFTALCYSVLSLMMLNILFGIVPVFIALLMFQTTRGIFFAWIGVMFRYALQPALLMVMIATIDDIANYNLFAITTDVCWRSLSDELGENHSVVIPLTIFGKNLYNIDIAQVIPWIGPKAVDENFSDLDSLIASSTLFRVYTALFMYFIIVHIEKNVLHYIDSISNMITGSYISSEESGAGQPGALLAKWTSNASKAISNTDLAKKIKNTDTFKGIQRFGNFVNDVGSFGTFEFKEKNRSGGNTDKEQMRKHNLESQNRR